MLDTTISWMAERLALSTGLNPALAVLCRIPSATMWNRLEGRPRSDNLARSLRAEVRDPLWMLARQWQLGEFEGEDAGMPVRARLLAQSSVLSTVSLGDAPAAPYDSTQPLEALVERHAVQADLMMALHIGRRWLAAIGLAFGAADPLVEAFRSRYAMATPVAGGKDLAALQLATHRVELQLRMAVAGKGIDGAALLADLAAAMAMAQQPSQAWVAAGLPVVVAQSAALDALAAEFAERYADFLFDPNAPDFPIAAANAWQPRQLEHQFAAGVAHADGSQTQLLANEYPGGRLDWYAFDVAGRTPLPGAAPAPITTVKSFVPTALRFAGMPNVRWWEFEDRHVGFGLSTAAKTDLVKLLLAEFALVFSNDWFILPFAASVGSLVETQGIVVTDNFGFNTLIEPTALRHDAMGLAGQWGLWTLSRRASDPGLAGLADLAGAADPRLLLAPAVGRSLESRPVDEVAFVRDEMANLVWAIESVIPDPLGGGRDARSAATLLREAIRLAYPEPALGDGNGIGASDVALAYELMGSVPENWVPLVSVRLQGPAVSSAFLQGAMPRVPQLEPELGAGGLPVLQHRVVLPRGTLLARDPVGQPMLVNEEEVLRSGAIVQRSFQQTRWQGGRTVSWAGRQKLNGRGESSSGLAFDQAKPVKAVKA